jgi:hypothetical protein
MKTLVISAIMLSDSIFKVKTDSKGLEGDNNDKVEKETLMKCFKEMCLALQNTSKVNNKLRAIRKKYSDEKYLGVAKFRI